MRKNILIIGSAGYIGSYLSSLLSSEHEVKGCDISDSPFTHIKKQGCELTAEELSPFDIVIYLAGFSGRALCMPHDFSRSYQENVVDIRTVAQQLTSSQVLLYASSASIVEGHGHAIQENCAIHETLLDKYALSMHIREKEIRQLPVRSIGFRFGTVIGISPNQRYDLVHLAMIRKALQTGSISVQHPECRRGILGLLDLGVCFYNVINQSESVQGNSVYHLSSFNTSIREIANEVSSKTGASMVVDESGAVDVSNSGFHLDCTAFSTRFGDYCTSSNESIVTLLMDYFLKAQTPCRVCGMDMSVVLDLGKQPLANNNVDEPCEQPTFPLVLSRCKDCHHTQQDYTVPPDQMFSSYQYMSGTSKTLCTYFSWLADSICKSFPVTETPRMVLELACNDGSQLDEFKKRGWKTSGVDPAKNIAELAKQKGHDVHVKFWGSEPVDIPTPDVILAQNVCAHVPHPIPFLKACHDAMGSHSKLYIQTSQCNMYQHGEFDTIYHEHLSFFTADSMKRAASLAGLVIIHVEKTPIHGTSYLFTMKRSDAEVEVDSTLEELITAETPYYQDSFFIAYKQRIYSIQKWVQNMATDFKEKGYTIVAFGAAAKGMTLLNFFNINQHITYIVDDAYMKQGKYTPNSNILIRNPNVLQEDNRKLAIIILAWNFMEEISSKIIEWRKGKETVLVIPYPQQLVRYLF